MEIGPQRAAASALRSSGQRLESVTPPAVPRGRPGGRLPPFAVLASVLAMAGGGLVLIGWAADVAVLKSVGPGLATMKFNTALGFVMAGGVLWLLQTPSQTARIRLLAGLCSIALVALAVLTLVEYAAGWPLGIDEAIVRDLGPNRPPSLPGRMSAATAMCFALLGTALLLLQAQAARATVWAQGLSVPVVLAGLIGLQGYVYAAHELHSFFLFSSMAVHTAVLFVAAGAGTLWARPHLGFVAVLTDRHAGGRFIRPVLLPLAALLMAIGWAVLHGQRSGWYADGVGVALFGTASITVIAALAWWLASRLNLAHAELEAQHDRLAASTRELEDLRTALV